MLTKVKISRSSASSWLLLLFIITISISAFITEFFQAPTEKTHVLNRYRKLIEEKKLIAASSIILKNSLGSYTLSRKGKAWELTAPRNLPANKHVAELILSTLKDINIRKVYQSDPINMSNFSLDTPVLEFSLIDSKGGQVDYLLGLVNPIDNSTYIQVPQKNIIYQVDALKNSFESFSLSDFINSNIFGHEASSLKELTVYRGSKSSKNIQISFKLLKGSWIGKKKRVLSETKVLSYLSKVFALKSTLIVDKSTDELKKALNEKLENPLYTVEVLLKDGKKVSYRISHIIRKLPELKLGKGQNILIKASNRKFFFIIHKDALKFFSQRQSQYRDLNFKKLFY